MLIRLTADPSNEAALVYVYITLRISRKELEHVGDPNAVMQHGVKSSLFRTRYNEHNTSNQEDSMKLLIQLGGVAR